MSKISTVYDEVVTVLEGLFPLKTRIPNAYSLLDNNEMLLRDAWGLKIGTGSPAPSEFKSFNRVRTFTITLTKEVIRLESDIDTIDTVTKNILEDIYTLEKRFINNDQLGIEAFIEIITQGGHSPVEFFEGDKYSFAAVDADFEINIRENL